MYFINGYLPFVIRQYSIICGWKTGIYFLTACYQLSGDKNRGKYVNARIGNFLN